MLKKDVPANSNIPGRQFVLSINNSGTTKEMCKAGFLVQGRTNQDKNLLAHSSTNIKQQTMRLLVSIAEIFGFRTFSQDISQAYLQSVHQLNREVFIKPSHGFRMKSNGLLKLLKPVYLLTDSGYYWHNTMI